MTRRALSTVLVANRGEIAVRIMRTCRELGLRTIAVYSDADIGTAHVRFADESHHIGGAAARDSYLCIDAVIGAALQSGADAVHPGYGLLSENAAFAAAVIEASMVFVGPDPTAIEVMGDKLSARRLAVSCDIPVPAGSDRLNLDDPAHAIEIAERIGWPVLVKASHGGGGRGMRVVVTHEDLPAAITSAAREAQASFGRPELHLEKYVAHARHVEVQVVGDTEGNVVHVGDRDCSVQRRNQKLIEEAPAPYLTDRLRTAIHSGAVRLARAIGYTGVGTVEYLIDPATDQYFFLEMNTRLQVEHPVTELVSGIDLVETQFIIAEGQALPWTQDDIQLNGHAIEARIAVEDPADAFRPDPGAIDSLVLPSGPWIRTDFGVQNGDTVTTDYDSMIGKIIARGQTRQSARRRLIAALEEFELPGRSTTAQFAAQVLASELFITVGHDTGSVNRDWELTEEPIRGARLVELAPMQTPRARITRIATDHGVVSVTVPIRTAQAGAVANTLSAQENTTGRRRTRGERAGSPTVTTPTEADVSIITETAPMDAVVASIMMSPGRRVAMGDVLVVLGAMKMEIEIKSRITGVVTETYVREGEAVSVGAHLVTVARETAPTLPIG